MFIAPWDVKERKEGEKSYIWKDKEIDRERERKILYEYTKKERLLGKLVQ